MRDIDKNNNIFKVLKKENGNNLFYYLTMLNLENDDNTLILSSIHHYYYDFNELKNIKTIIQVKELNKISNINIFLGNITKVLSSNANLIGCFKDNKIYGNNILLKMTNLSDWILSKFDGKPNHYLSRKKVINLLNKYDLKIIDITEIENLTYFCIQK